MAMLYVLRRWAGDDEPPTILCTFDDGEEAATICEVVQEHFTSAAFDIFSAEESELRAQGVIR